MAVAGEAYILHESERKWDGRNEDLSFYEGAEGLRLELSNEGRYALRALLYLAWLGERATADS